MKKNAMLPRETSPQRFITLKEIAERVNTTRSTVSLALRNHPSISIAMRERVQSVAKEMGYRPNLLASTLMTEMRQHQHLKKEVTLGLVVSHGSDNYLPEGNSLGLTLRGVFDRAQECGIHLDVLPLYDGQMTEKRLEKIIAARNLPGVIIAPLGRPNVDLKINFSNTAVVAIGHSVVSPQMHRSLSHQAQCQSLAMDMLCSRGRERIGLAAPFSKSQTIDNNWIHAYFYYFEMILEKRHPPLFLYDERLEVDQVRFRTLFLRWVEKVRPDAIIGIHPLQVFWLREEGYRVPEDLAWAHLSWRPSGLCCSGVDPKHRLIGSRAVDLLVTQLHQNERGYPAHPRILMTEGEWVEGKTVPPPGDGTNPA